MCIRDRVVKNVDFKVFSGPASDPKGRVAAICLKDGCNQLSRKQIDDYDAYVRRYGAKGLAYIKCNDLTQGMEGLQSPILKFIGEEGVNNILQAVGAETGDIVFFGAGAASVVNDSLGALRLKLGEDCGLVAEGWRPLWVIDLSLIHISEPTRPY